MPRPCPGGADSAKAPGCSGDEASIDADILADLRPKDAAPFVAAPGDHYYASEDRVHDAVERRGSFNLIHLGTMLKIDVFVAKDRAFERRALDRARPESLEGETGRAVPLASAEDIVLAKLEWFRKGGEVSERQWSDVIGVLRVGEGRLDVAYLRDLALDLGVPDLLERAVAETARA